MNIRSIFLEHLEVFEATLERLPSVLDRAAIAAAACLDSGGKLLVCGNGGSAADAQHFAAELVGRFARERRGLAAVALTTDSSALTSIANDFGYDQVFARQVEALARPGDMLIAISTSGNSPNVLAAAHEAHTIGCSVVGLTGEGGGRLAEIAGLLVEIPSANVQRVQEMHGLCLHALAESIEARVVAGLQTAGAALEGEAV